MNLDKYLVDGSEEFKIADYVTSENIDEALVEEYKAKSLKSLKKISKLQEKLYAEGKEGLVVVLQAMDAAGKDSTIEHVMSGVNPQGVKVVSFKSPNSTELSHDYLWRVGAALPPRGQIGILNRSHYEDVLICRVKEFNKGYAMPKRCVGKSTEEFYAERYEQIANFEKYLYQNGYRVVKIMLHVGLDEQKNRFLDRINDPEKNWKFSAGDLKERALWPQYMEAFELAINGTAQDCAPWYVVPADQKFYARYVVSKIIEEALEDIDPQFPELPEEERAALADCKAQLEAE